MSPTDSGEPTPAPTYVLSEFERFRLPRKVLAALILQDVEQPTPVQSAVIPDAMAGHDVLGRARTGSGKTLAFGIPVVARLAGATSRVHHPRALIIVPTRELAAQVERSLELVARAVGLRLTTVYGGTRYDRQIQQLRQGTDIVVATPGRLQDLIDRGALDTADVEVTVLDEADHLCDLGFYPAVDALLSQLPTDGQRLLLSATLDGDVDRLVATHLRSPRRHDVDPGKGVVTTMAHHVMVVGGYRDKIRAAVRLVEANPRAIVFTRTRQGATELRDALAQDGVQAVDLHGNLSQRLRERNLRQFSDGRAQAVVATDVAARGIHVDGVGIVIHFDPPADAKAYLHRSGRTARAGEAGAVVTIVTPRQTGSAAAMHRQVGVTARHHDLRTAPPELSAAALATSGSEAPSDRGPARRPHHKGGPRPRTGRPGQTPGRGKGRGAPAKPRTKGGQKPRPATGKSAPAKGQKSGRPARQESYSPPASSRRTGKKARWNKSDRPR